MEEFLSRPDDEKWFTIWLIAIAIGLVMGYFLRQESIKRKPIHGGMVAQLFHYIAATMICSIIPWAIIGLLGGLHLAWLFPVGITFPLSTLALLMVYGIFESQADVVEVAPVRELD